MSTRAYTKRSRAASEEATRTALLDAAEDAFFAGDWARTSLDAIAAEAGTTKQTLLRHFGSKDGLLVAGYRRATEDIRSQRFATPPGDVEAAVDNLLDHYADVGHRALKIGAMGPVPALGEIGQNARRLHYDWVDHAFGEQPPRVRAALIAACDVQTWAILAIDLGLERTEVRATLLMTIRRLLEEDA